MRGAKKQLWTREEDKILKALTRNQPVWGIEWMKVAKKHRNQMKERMVVPPLRSPKQCRERWNLYLRTDVKRGSWSETEDLQLIDLYRKFGNKYSSIAKALCRTDVCVRNRIRSTQRMVERHLDRGLQRNSVRKDGALFAYFLSLGCETNNIKQEKIDDVIETAPILGIVLPPLELVQTPQHQITDSIIEQEIDDVIETVHQITDFIDIDKQEIDDVIEDVSVQGQVVLPLPPLMEKPQHQITDLMDLDLDLLLSTWSQGDLQCTSPRCSSFVKEEESFFNFPTEIYC